MQLLLNLHNHKILWNNISLSCQTTFCFLFCETNWTFQIRHLSLSAIMNNLFLKTPCNQITAGSIYVFFWSIETTIFFRDQISFLFTGPVFLGKECGHLQTVAIKVAGDSKQSKLFSETTKKFFWSELTRLQARPLLRLFLFSPIFLLWGAYT